MNRSKKTKQLVIAAVLCAVGIFIPMISPLKIVIEPASFTLASHVAVFIAMLISPGVAAGVAVGTALGFLLGGFPITIVARAASHLVFAFGGAVFLKKRPHALDSSKKVILFSFAVSIVHAICEVGVVLPFYLGGQATNGILYQVFVLVGVGTVVHSMIDFYLAYFIWRTLEKNVRIV